MGNRTARRLLILSVGISVAAILLALWIGWIDAELAAGLLTAAVGISTLAVCAATIWNVRLTADMCREMRDARLSQWRPFVVIDFDLELEKELLSIWLRVLNRGASPATNLKVTVFHESPSVQELRDRFGLDRATPVLDNTFEFLGPDRDVAWWMAGHREAIVYENMALKEDLHGLSYRVEFCYTDPFTQMVYQGQYVMDIGEHLAIHIPRWMTEHIAEGNADATTMKALSRSTVRPSLS